MFHVWTRLMPVIARADWEMNNTAIKLTFVNPAADIAHSLMDLEGRTLFYESIRFFIQCMFSFLY